MELNKKPAALAEMLIRRPPHEVFEAFVDPEITSKFWFTHGSGRLDENSKVTWEWRMYGVSTLVEVREIVKDEKIAVEWNDPPSTIVWTFTPMPDGATFVSIRNSGFPANPMTMSTRRLPRPKVSPSCWPAPRPGWNRA